jgi:hypothetical protein
MANTYTLIESKVLGSTASSVTFSAIPATYTDLVLKISARCGELQPEESVNLRFNGSTVANYSLTRLRGNGASLVSSRSVDDNSVTLDRVINGNTSTANTFNSLEIYIPSYTASTYKPVSSYSATENNSATSAYLNITAGLWRNTSAITSIFMYPNSGNGFLATSSFYLYGISNS